MDNGQALEKRLESLRDCLVEGDSAQEWLTRRNQRCALLASIVLQLMVLAGLILFPLFTKGENIAGRAILVPQIPYSPGTPHQAEQNRTRPAQGHTQVCRFCPSRSIPTTIVMHDRKVVDETPGNEGPAIPGVPGGQAIPGLPPSISVIREAPVPPVTPRRTERLHLSGGVVAAKLIRRVLPAYPALAVSLHREGRVELHAIIATDGSIQSLEVVTGDPLFIPSALTAVRQWRYQPTWLNGQPVEVETYITVVYTLNRE